jgi:tRNA pseudouridine65 synthase
MTTSAPIDWSDVPLGPGVEVIEAHPCGLAALGKPAGVLSHPNRSGEEKRSLIAAPYDTEAQHFAWTDASGAARRVWLLHRLDSATSGVVLVAAEETVAAAVRAAFEKRTVEKRYLALVLGHMREKSALWRDTMNVRRDSGIVRARDDGRLPAETAVRCVRLIPGPPALSLLELEPHTGRTHQLRHQCARRRLPIVGDQTYGNFPVNRDLARRFGTDRLFLHAHSVRLEFTLASGRIRFAAEAPPPEEFRAFLARG